MSKQKPWPEDGIFRSPGLYTIPGETHKVIVKICTLELCLAEIRPIKVKPNEEE